MNRGASIRVWDLPTRLFHWLLVALFAVAWWTAKHDQMDWHLRSGMLLLALLAFRLTWGVIGGSTARFTGFVKGPRGVIAYLRGRSGSLAAGHNPLGALSVVALLLLLAMQIVSGLFAVDVDGLESGPLSYLVSFDRGRQASHLHGWSFNLLLVLIALHLAAILWYRLRGRNLLLPMVTGRDAHLPPGSTALQPASTLRLVAAIAVAAALAWWINKGAPL